MNKKGVTISTMAVAIALMIFLAGFSIIFGTSSIQYSNVDKLESVIDTVTDNVNLYYLENKQYPILSGTKPVDLNSLPNDLKKQMVDLNDYATELYVLDIEKLKIPNLEIGTSKDITNNDVFLVNEISGTVYYYKGINFRGHKVYTNIRNAR